MILNFISLYNLWTVLHKIIFLKQVIDSVSGLVYALRVLFLINRIRNKLPIIWNNDFRCVLMNIFTVPSTKVLHIKNCFCPLSLINVCLWFAKAKNNLHLCWQNDLRRQLNVMKWGYSNSQTMWNAMRIIWTWNWMATQIWNQKHIYT